MNIRNLKIIKGILAFAATLLVLYGAHFLWQRYLVMMPLNQALMDIKGVQSATVEKPTRVSDPVKISVTFNNISNFQKTYTEVNEKVIQALKNKPYKITINENGNDELEKLFSDINLYIEKALIDGSFPSLVEKSGDMAELIGAKSNITIDDKYIYVHISKGDYSLYKLIPRSSRRVGEK